MSVVLVVGAPLLRVFVYLWSRRGAWPCPWAVCSPMAVGLHGTATALAMPVATGIVGDPLHWMTGIWGLDDHLSHLCSMSAALVLAASVLGRLEDHGEGLIQTKFNQAIWAPYVLGVAISTALYPKTSMAKVRAPWLSDLGDIDAAGVLYYLVVGGVLSQIVVTVMRALLVLHRDRIHRRAAKVYLITCVLTLCAASIKIGAIILPLWRNTASSLIVWGLMAAIGLGMVIANEPPPPEAATEYPA